MPPNRLARGFCVKISWGGHLAADVEPWASGEGWVKVGRVVAGITGGGRVIWESICKIIHVINQIHTIYIINSDWYWSIVQV